MKNAFSLASVVAECKRITIGRTVLYQWNSFILQLREKSVYLENGEDPTLIPFYCVNGKRLELYDFELIVVQSKNQTAKLRLQTRLKDLCDMGRTSIAAKLSKCIIELGDEDRTLITDKITDYFLYVQNSEEIRDQICKSYDTFDTNNLYFEFYD